MTIASPADGHGKEIKPSPTLSQDIESYEILGDKLVRGLKQNINNLPLEGVRHRQEGIAEMFKINSRINANIALVRKSLNKRSVELRVAESRKDKATGRRIGAPSVIPNPDIVLLDPSGLEFIFVNGKARYIIPDPATKEPELTLEPLSTPLREEDNQVPEYS